MSESDVSQAESPSRQGTNATDAHNLVLIRSHEPARSAGSRWLSVAPVCVALAAGLGIWFYLAEQPKTSIINHAVASSSQGSPNAGSN
jgi:hypothetical protein